MTKTTKKIVLGLMVFMTIIFSSPLISLAETTTPAPASKPAPAVNSSDKKEGDDQINKDGGLGNIIRTVGKNTQLPSFDAGHASQSYQSGASNITSIIYFLIDFLKYSLGSIAVLMIIISGMKLVLSARTVNEALNKEKETLRFAFSGLLIIIVADQVVRAVFFGEEGEVYRTGTDIQMAAERANSIFSGVGNLIKIFIPVMAVLTIIFAAVRLINSRGEPEALNKAKTQITWTVFGLILAGLAEGAVFIIFPDQGTRFTDTQALNKLVITMTNFISGFMSTIAVIMMIYAGYIYVTSLGGENTAKAKKTFTAAIIGLFIAMAAYGLVNTFVKIETPTNSQVNNQPVVGGAAAT